MNRRLSAHRIFTSILLGVSAGCAFFLPAAYAESLPAFSENALDISSTSLSLSAVIPSKDEGDDEIRVPAACSHGYWASATESFVKYQYTDINSGLAVAFGRVELTCDWVASHPECHIVQVPNYVHQCPEGYVFSHVEHRTPKGLQRNSYETYCQSQGEDLHYSLENFFKQSYTRTQWFNINTEQEWINPGPMGIEVENNGNLFGRIKAPGFAVKMPIPLPSKRQISCFRGEVSPEYNIYLETAYKACFPEAPPADRVADNVRIVDQPISPSASMVCRRFGLPKIELP